MPSLQGTHPTTASPTSSPTQLADALCDALAQGHNIPAFQVPLGNHVVVSLWYGLTARCGGGLIWWTYQPREDRVVLTFARSPACAAARLARLYAAAVHRGGPALGMPLPGVGQAGPVRSVEGAAVDQLAAAHTRP
jgi:hypothetical protein